MHCFQQQKLSLTLIYKRVAANKWLDFQSYYWKLNLKKYDSFKTIFEMHNSQNGNLDISKLVI